MHHVERRTFHPFRQADHPVERQLLRQRVVHLRHVLEADTVLPHQLLVHEHDDVVVLGVNRRDAARLRDGLQCLPDVAVLHHAAGVAGTNVGGEDLDAGMAGLHRFRQLFVLADGDLAHQRQMEAVVAVARALPVRVGLLDRGLDRAVVRALHEIDQRRGAAEQRGAADLRRRIGVFRLRLAGKADRRQAVDVRIDAAGDHHLAGRIDGACRGTQRARRTDHRDLAAGDADIRRGGAARQHTGSA